MAGLLQKCHILTIALWWMLVSLVLAISSISLFPFHRLFLFGELFIFFFLYNLLFDNPLSRKLNINNGCGTIFGILDRDFAIKEFLHVRFSFHITEEVSRIRDYLDFLAFSAVRRGVRINELIVGLLQVYFFQLLAFLFFQLAVLVHHLLEADFILPILRYFLSHFTFNRLLQQSVIIFNFCRINLMLSDRLNIHHVLHGFFDNLLLHKGARYLRLIVASDSVLEKQTDLAVGLSRMLVGDQLALLRSGFHNFTAGVQEEALFFQFDFIVFVKDFFRIAKLVQVIFLRQVEFSLLFLNLLFEQQLVLLLDLLIFQNVTVLINVVVFDQRLICHGEYDAILDFIEVDVYLDIHYIFTNKFVKQQMANILLLVRFTDVGTVNLEQKILEFLQQPHESIAIFVTQHQHIKPLALYEQILVYLYNLAFQATQDPCAKFNVFFEDYHQAFPKNPLDLVINLGTSIQSSINFEIKPSEQRLQLKPSEFEINQFKRGANGGTFDHFHVGHKILMSLSLLAVKQHLTIGITGDSLLKNKHLKGFIQSYHTRARLVAEFCRLFRPDVEIFLIELTEPAGPTKDGVYDGLIVTDETLTSIKYINDLRKELNLNTLDAYIVPTQSFGLETKISSSHIRKYIHEHNHLSEEEYQYIKSEWSSVSDNLYWFESILVDYYSQKQRFYHTLRHIYELLRNLHQVHNQKVVKLAIFFHDAIYYPKLKDNEEQSARLFKTYAQENNINEPLVELFILQTKSHSIDVPDIGEAHLDDLKEFLDLDLLILQSDSYVEYSQQIRNEYIHINDADFRSGRTHVMEKFLQRPQIYFKRDDKKARENIHTELLMLRGD